MSAEVWLSHQAWICDRHLRAGWKNWRRVFSDSVGTFEAALAEFSRLGFDADPLSDWFTAAADEWGKLHDGTGGMLAHAYRGMVTGLQAQCLAGDSGAAQVQYSQVAEADRYYKQLAKQHHSAAPSVPDMQKWLNNLRVDHEEARNYFMERAAAENWDEKLPRSYRKSARWGVIVESMGSGLLAREMANQEDRG